MTEVTGFNSLMGLAFESISEDAAVASVTVGDHLLQRYGVVHGGVYCAIVEAVASAAAARWFGGRGDVVGVANHTDFLRAVRGGVLCCNASPVSRGRLEQLWSADILDENGRLVARGSVRFVNIASAADLGRSGVDA